MRNPFTPNFGQVPIHLAGRALLISEIARAFDNAPGDPSLTTILIGARGTGKTALLTYLASMAEEQGWLAVNVSCLPGMLQEILDQTRHKAYQFVEGGASRRLSALSVGDLVGVEWENTAVPSRTWRGEMTELLEALNEQGIGLVVTVDEVDPDLDEMIQLAAVHQHFIREERKVALLMAGLPYKVSALLGNKSVSFLRRSCQQRIGRIEDREINSALRQTIEAFDKTIDEDATAAAVEGIDGSPFMLQLVGFRSWEAAGGRPAIALSDVEDGLMRAADDMKARVLRSTLDEASDGDLEFLEAMLQDETTSAAPDIAMRLGKSAAHVATYRRRLLEQGIIEMRGRTSFAFALPLLREYLPEYLGDCN